LTPLSPDPAVVIALDKALGNGGLFTRKIAERALQILAARHSLVSFADLALLYKPIMAPAKEELDAFIAKAPVGIRHKALAFFEEQSRSATTTSKAAAADSPAPRATFSRDGVAQRLLLAFQHARSADYSPAISMFFSSDKPARFHEQVKVEIAESEVILFCPSCTNKRYKFTVPSSGSLSVNQLLRHLRTIHNCADAGARDKTQTDEDSDSERDEASSSKRKNTDMADTPTGAAKKKHGPIDAFMRAKPPAAAATTTATAAAPPADIAASTATTTAAPPPAPAPLPAASATATTATLPAGAVLSVRGFQCC
jgi:hypothetical protein